MGLPVRRGEIRLVDLDPVVGSEANTRRPAIIVSNDRANEAVARFGRGVLTVVPLTSNVANIRPFQVFLDRDDSGLHKDSKAQAEQIRSIAVERVGPIVGGVPITLMRELDAAIRLHLDV